MDYLIEIEVDESFIASAAQVRPQSSGDAIPSHTEQTPPCMFGNSSQVRSGNTLKRAFSLVGKGEHLSVLIHDACFLHFGKNPVRRALRHIERLVDIGQPHCSVFMNLRIPLRPTQRTEIPKRRRLSLRFG